MAEPISTSSSSRTLDEQREVDEAVAPVPKPPTPPTSPPAPLRNLLDFPEVLQLSVDPPPPYKDRRRHAAGSGNASHANRPLRRSQHVSEHSGEDLDDNVESESSPLLGHSRRHRTISQSTVQSNQSLTRTMFSLFQGDQSSPDLGNLSEPKFWYRVGRYFRPMKQRRYYSAAMHLLIINFPFALATWIYLFVAAFVGAALLLALPLGALLCWLALFGGRVAARAEIALQTRFHGPLSTSPPNPPHPYVGGASTMQREDVEGHTSSASVGGASFFKRSYAMFTDAASYQNIFYFLVVKPAITLMILVGLLVLLPVSLLLVVPFPAVLRATRKIGIAQANIALESLS